MTAELVEDFVAEPGTFFLGVKGLNINSVLASRNNKERVIPVVARHLCREIRAETCWSGGRINPSRSALNYSMLPGPTTSAAITAAAMAAMVEHGVILEDQRKDRIVAVELVFSLPSDFQGDARAFFMDALEWTRKHFLAPMKIVAAVVHADEANLHMHVVIVPLAGLSRMDGHAVVGFKGLRNQRIDSFHQEVAQQYGLRKPRRKTKLTYAQRRQLADLVLARLVADGAAWAGNPAAVAAMRKTLTVDPMPMADVLGLLDQDAGAGELEQTVYAVADGDAAALPGDLTAYLCDAVDLDLASAVDSDGPDSELFSAERQGDDPDESNQLDANAGDSIRADVPLSTDAIEPPIDTAATASTATPDASDSVPGTCAVDLHVDDQDAPSRLMPAPPTSADEQPPIDADANSKSLEPVAPGASELGAGDPGQQADDAGAANDGDSWRYVHDDEQPVEYWDWDTGRLVTPPPKRASRKADVAALLRAVVSTKGPISTALGRITPT